VLAVIPALALGGPVLTDLVRRSEAAVGVGGRFLGFPLTPVGLLAALAVVAYTLFALGPADR
jgi:hypothetical protein